MGIYIFLLLFSLIGAFYSRRTKSYGYIVFSLMFLLSLGRGETVGNDTAGYYNNVFSSAYEGEIHKFEFVFIWLCDFIRDNGLNSRCCIYLLSFVTFLFLYLSIKRYRVSLAVACYFYLLFLFYTQSIHIARQMAACSILLYAYSFLFINKDVNTPRAYNSFFNIVCFSFYVLLATSFHSGAIIGYIVLLFYSLNDRISAFFKTQNISAINLFLVLFVLFTIVQLLRSVFLAKFQGLLTIADMYDGYTTSERAMSFFGVLYSSIVYYFHANILFLLFKNGNSKLGSFFLCTLLMGIFLSAFNGVIYRLIFYFSIIDVIAYAKCFSYLIKKRRFLFWLILFYMGVDYMLILVNNTYETVPYVFKMIEIYE